MKFFLPSASKNVRTGLLFGAFAAITYGMNPTFALPLYRVGFSPDAVLFLRYMPAVLALAVWMKLRHVPFALSKIELACLIPAGLLFSVSSLTLFQSYRMMDAGIASTLLFVYPLMVALIMAFGFRENVPVSVWIAMLFAFAGIFLLYERPDGSHLSTAGILLVMISSLSYALYLIGINKTVLRDMNPFKLTFYALLFGLSVYLVRLRGGLDIRGEWSMFVVADVVGLALLPTLVSLVCTALAVPRIGATATAILGALEPLTAVVLGVLLFGELLTARIVTGMVLVLVSVSLVVVLKRPRHRATGEDSTPSVH